MCAKILGSPSRYVQGANVLAEIGKYLVKYSNKVLFLTDKFVLPLVKDQVEAGVKDYDVELFIELFNGESTEKEVDRVKDLAEKYGCGAIAGCGGGKTIDTAKAASFKLGLKTIVIPTAASTDAPCSSLAVMYSEDHEYLYDLFLPQNPNLVLVDTQIIANAPVRLLVAGIGDAFATYYEARSCRASDAENMFQGKATQSAFALAKLCKDILMEEGYYAKMAAENHCVTNSLESLVEANIYLSGVGFESNGCAIAHGVYNGMTTLKKHGYLHGECVAFCTLIQMIVENIPTAELEENYAFYEKVGLPTTLAQLGLELTDEEFAQAAKASCDIGITHNMPFEITPFIIENAMRMADTIGRSRK